MAHDLPSDVQDLILHHLSTGQYASEDDVLRAALRALAFHQDELVALQAGIDAMEAGQLRPFEDVDAELRHRFGFSDEG